MFRVSGVETAPIVGVCLATVSAIFVKVSFQSKNKLRLDRSIPDFDDEPVGPVEQTTGTLSAVYKQERAFPLLLLGFSLLAWAGLQLWNVYEKTSFNFKGFYLASGLIFFMQTVLAVLHRPYKAKQAGDDKHVVVLIPAYNESEIALRHCLESLLAQTRRPDEVHVVDDGSKQSYAKLKKWFTAEAAAAGVAVTWVKKRKNLGKRAAHATGLQKVKARDNTIIVTVDSDGILDKHAIREGLKPFEDTHVESVAGLLLTKNLRSSLLTRITDLIFLGMQQLIDRSAMSELNSVLVNSGSLAFYRMPVIADALANGYTHERFLGRHVEFSDDSFLTLFALLKGKTVQQPTAMVFSDMPQRMSHHVRQQMRWMRGSFIRSFWRIRYLPVLSWGFIRQLVGWITLLVNTTILVEILFVLPIEKHAPIPAIVFVIPVALGFIQSARYFTIVRSDVPLRAQIGIFLLSPIAAVWSIVVLRAFRVWGMITCWKTGWGTRHKVEIEHDEQLTLEPITEEVE